MPAASKFALVALTLFGCDAASSDPGLSALLQVEGAQYRPGPFPTDEGGPPAIALSTFHASIIVGRLDEPLQGILDPTARGAAIGIEGVDGAWLIAADVPALETPGLPTANAVFGVADDFPPGPFTLLVAGTNERGFGASISRPMVADVALPPGGELVIGLVWNGPADLDLHVVAPDGEAWSDDPNTRPAPPPGTPVDPDDYKLGGILDHDGNKDCRRDGRPNEHVIWRRVEPPAPPIVPPDGRYIVRVDARSMCGTPSEAWYVAAYRRDGSVIGAARGVATPADVLHGIEDPGSGRAGAGVTALEFACAMGECNAP